jgi:hypothetical protein
MDAAALSLNGAISTPSNTRGSGLTPDSRFPLIAKIVFSKDLFLIFNFRLSSGKGLEEVGQFIFSGQHRTISR